MPGKRLDMHRYESTRVISTLVDWQSQDEVTMHIAEIEFEPNAIRIAVEGFSTKNMQEGGAIIWLEVWNGELRIICYPNINQEEPMIITMKQAKEKYREKE